jgi:hypothetical protein
MFACVLIPVYIILFFQIVIPGIHLIRYINLTVRKNEPCSLTELVRIILVNY